MCRVGSSEAVRKVDSACTTYCHCNPEENWVSCVSVITLNSPVKTSCYFSESMRDVIWLGKVLLSIKCGTQHAWCKVAQNHVPSLPAHRKAPLWALQSGVGFFAFSLL